MNMRWAITHISDGWRIVSFLLVTWTTKEEAEKALEEYKPELRGRILTDEQMDTLEVALVECYDNGQVKHALMIGA